MKKEGRWISLKTKMNLLLIGVILAVSIGLLMIAYAVHSQKIDSIYISNVNKAALLALDSLNYQELRYIRDVVISEEFQSVRKRAVDAGDPGILESWMLECPAYYDSGPVPAEEYSFFDEYRDACYFLDELRRHSGVTDVYIQYDEKGITYNIVDPDENLLYIGSIEPPTPEFASAEDNARISAMVYRNQFGWLCTACEPFDDYGSTYSYEDLVATGYVCVDMDMDTVMRERHWFLLNSLVFVAILTAIAMALSVFLVNRTAVAPLKLLAKGTRQFTDTQNGYSMEDVIQAHITSHDEIGDLYHDIQAMQKHIVEYTHDLAKAAAEKERQNTEMRLAAEIQKSMLPGESSLFPGRTEFDLCATMDPAREVGGDFYDFFLIDENHLGLVIADVSGKGVPAALFMMSAKMLISQQAMTGGTPADILKKVNDRICQSNQKSQMFVTVWIGMLDLLSGHMICASAGHEYPMVRRSGGEFTLFKDPHGFVAGGMENVRYRNYEMDLQPEDAVFVYTDGVTEATNGKGELYGDKRLASALQGMKGETCQHIVDHVRASIDSFVDGEEQFDDLTMLCLIYKGRADGEMKTATDRA